MKKLAIVLAILMLVPASAFSMQMLSDSGMAQITGQSGVSIAMDDVQLFINIDQLYYVDNDGLSSSATMQIEDAIGAPGALYIQDFQIDVLNINAIVGTDADSRPETWNLKSTSAGHIDLFYKYASTAPLSGGHLLSSPGGLKGLENYTSPQTNPGLSGYFFGQYVPDMIPVVPFIANAITIEVTDRLPALTEGLNYNTGAEWFSNGNLFAGMAGAPEGAGLFYLFGYDTHRTNVGGVFITMPTAEIYIQDLSFTVAYGGDVYAQTLVPIDGGIRNPYYLYMGPMGNLTSHAINDNNVHWPITNTTPYPLEGDFGSIGMRGITFTQLGGWMEIAPH